jgi:hypothetical protein
MSKSLTAGAVTSRDYLQVMKTVERRMHMYITQHMFLVICTLRQA